jgi:hypothetical protein
LKVRVAQLEGVEPDMMSFIDAALELRELEDKIRKYPKRVKTMLKS